MSDVHQQHDWHGDVLSRLAQFDDRHCCQQESLTTIDQFAHWLCTPLDGYQCEIVQRDDDDDDDDDVLIMIIEPESALRQLCDRAMILALVRCASAGDIVTAVPKAQSLAQSSYAYDNDCSPTLLPVYKRCEQIYVWRLA